MECNSAENLSSAEHSLVLIIYEELKREIPMGVKDRAVHQRKRALRTLTVFFNGT